MKLAIFSIVLDGMPYIERHYPIFCSLNCDWQWIVVEGVAGNLGSTKWCQPQGAHLSRDGTNEYLRSLKHDKRVTHIPRAHWPSKDQMCNAALERISEPCVLLQVDADEIHTASNIEKMVQLFRDDPQLGAMRLPCRFWVGPQLYCTGENVWSNRHNEWERVWRYQPGARYLRHEPPQLHPCPGKVLSRQQSAAFTFEHYAYVTEAQITYKQEFYGYLRLVNQWKALQCYQHFPVSLDRFFSFLKPTESPTVVRA